MDNTNTNENSDNIIREIINECYWDYHVKPDDIQKIVSSDNFRYKQKLFSKIIYNSKDKYRCLKIFKQDDLPGLFDSFSPSRNQKLVAKYLLALRNIFLGENNVIEGLRWKKR